LSFLYDDFKSVANFIVKNQTRVSENHHLEPSTLNAQGGFARCIPDVIAFRRRRRIVSAR
jgi:hypothetical protein